MPISLESKPRVAPLRRVMREALMSNQSNPPAAAPDPLVLEATSKSESTPPTTSVAPPGPGSDGTKTWNSVDLLGSETEAFILHRGQTYRLRCTKQGKLILYK